MFDKFCFGKIDGGPISSDNLPQQFDASRRTSVSAECFNQACGKNASFCDFSTPRCAQQQPECLPERSMFKSCWSDASLESVSNLPALTREVTPERVAMLRRAEDSLRKMIVFEDLSDDLMQRVLDSMRERECDAGFDIITQGEEGNELYVLDKGSVEFIVNGTVQGHATNGAIFGELALFYNSPRAATVRATSHCRMLTVDRLMFKNMVVEKLSIKRIHSQQVLASIDVFAGLPQALQWRIADALHPTTFHKGDVVISQGDRGTEFFMIDEGAVEIEKDGKVVGTQGRGSYFGELALIYDIPRVAMVRAASDRLKVEVLTSREFEALIGADLVAELRKRDPRKRF